jgi:Fungal specific transcription factor domain
MPEQSSPLWLAQLFAILHISSRLGNHAASETPDSTDASLEKDLFLRCAGSCLVLGKYAQPQRYVVEALLLYAQCKYISKLDQMEESGALLGVIVRVAMRMGYHRDAKHLSGISAFDGEMRRRTWAVIRQLDILGSFQMGLPNFIQSNFCDTDIPRNLMDNDFDDQTMQLPPSRPDTEPTDMLYYIAKSRMLNVLGEIIKLSLSLEIVPYDEVMRLDGQLRLVHDSIPLHLRMRPISQCFADPTHLILGRVNCELLYQKSVCVLHRKYIGNDPSYGRSREACTDAALTILDIQAQLREESRPGGHLFRDRWMLSSITLHDFLLAATIICFGLFENQKVALEDPSIFDHKVDALKRSQGTFLEQSAHSKQAARCAAAIGYMLPRIESEAPKHNNTVETLETSGHQGHPSQIHNGGSYYKELLVEPELQLNDTETVDWVCPHLDFASLRP